MSRLFESGWSLRLAGEFIFVAVRPFVLALSRIDDRYALGGQAAPNFLCYCYDGQGVPRICILFFFYL